MGNPIGHWEILVSDLAKGKEFYSTVFDWEFDESSFPGYDLIKTGMDPGGGMLVKPEEAPEYGINTYFQVDDIDATLAKATAAGATIIAPKTAIPGIGHWGMFADPDGIAIGLLQGE
ncbi:MAG TPA: VOC family protein [Thermoleophilia bacterium]|nr:VOC family protein [Thermoleophilia bacterium]